MNYIHKTRYKGLQYRRSPRLGWSFVDQSTGQHIGPWYQSEVELLADMQTFADARGFTV